MVANYASAGQYDDELPWRVMEPTDNGMLAHPIYYVPAPSHRHKHKKHHLFSGVARAGKGIIKGTKNVVHAVTPRFLDSHYYKKKRRKRRAARYQYAVARMQRARAYRQYRQQPMTEEELLRTRLSAYEQYNQQPLSQQDLQHSRLRNYERDLYQNARRGYAGERQQNVRSGYAQEFHPNATQEYAQELSQRARRYYGEDFRESGLKGFEQHQRQLENSLRDYEHYQQRQHALSDDKLVNARMANMQQRLDVYKMLFYALFFDWSFCYTQPK